MRATTQSLLPSHANLPRPPCARVATSRCGPPGSLNAANELTPAAPRVQKSRQAALPIGSGIAAPFAKLASAALRCRRQGQQRVNAVVEIQAPAWPSPPIARQHTGAVPPSASNCARCLQAAMSRWEAGHGHCVVSRVTRAPRSTQTRPEAVAARRDSRSQKLRFALAVLLNLLPLSGSIDWYWDGIRYIQILEPRDETGSSPDGEYWTNYEPDPPDEYKWETFKAHSRDSHARDGEHDRPDGSTCELGDFISNDLRRCTEQPDELRAPRPSRTIPGWPGLTAETTVSLTEGDTSTLAELGHPIGFGEWTKRTRYDDTEGHPHLEYIEEAKDDCYHPFLVECMNGGTCYDLFEDHYCHCAKGFYGKHCELGELIAQPAIPPRWRCPVSSLGNGDGCDCDCGGYDPDCADTSQPILNCKPAEICVNKTTAGDTYGMCVITLAAKPRQFRPRFTPGITFGVAFSEDDQSTFLGAFDTTTGQIYHIRTFPYDGPSPTYGNSVYDEKNQVYYCLVDRIHDADLQTRLIGINVETADMVIDQHFNHSVSSVQFDQIDGAIYFLALEDEADVSSLIRFNISSQSLERVTRETAHCPPNSVIEDLSCVFGLVEVRTHDNVTNVTTVDYTPEPQDFGIEVGDRLNLKHFEHTYGMAALDDVVHIFYAVVRLTPHINGLIGVSTRTGTVMEKASLPHEITSIDINPRYSEHRHSYQELHKEVHLRAPLVGLAGPPALDSSPLTEQLPVQNKLFYIDPRNKTDTVTDAAALYGEQEAQLFLAAYDTIRNNEYAVTDDEFAHSHISTDKADLQGKEQQHYIAKALQNPDGFVGVEMSQFPFITEIRPWSGPTWGNTTVNVTGLNFFDTDRIECRFGPLTVHGAFDPLSRSIVCIAPPQPPGKVVFELSMYGDGHLPVGERITNQVKYDYFEPENATWLVPGMGPSYGNTSLIMKGGVFFRNATSSEWRCKFLDVETDGVYLTDQLSQCWVPPESSLEDFDDCTALCGWWYKHTPFAQDDVDLCVSKCVHGGGIGYGIYGYPSGFRDVVWPYEMIPVDPMPEPEPEPEEGIFIPVVFAVVEIDLDIELIEFMGPDDYALFVADLESDFGTSLGIDSERVEVVSVVGGSLIVTFTVQPDASGAALPIDDFEDYFIGTMTLPAIQYTGIVNVISVTVTAVKLETGNSTSTALEPQAEPDAGQAAGRRLGALLRRLQGEPTSAGTGTMRQMQEANCAIVADPVSSYGPAVTAGSCGANAVGSICLLGCQSGFEPTASVPGTCTVDAASGLALWSGAYVECAISCGEPPHLGQGRAKWSTTTVGSVVVYTCDDGWQLAEPQHPSRICGPEGTWIASNGSVTTPECTRRRSLQATSGARPFTDVVGWWDTDVDGTADFLEAQEKPEEITVFDLGTDANASNFTEEFVDPCYTPPIVCYADEIAYEEAMAEEARLAALGLFGNSSALFDPSITNGSNATQVVFAPDATIEYIDGCMVTGPSPDGNPHGMTAPEGSECAATFSDFGAIYTSCTMEGELLDFSTPTTPWCYVPLLDADGSVLDDCMSDLGHDCLMGFCTGCVSPEANLTVAENGTKVNGTLSYIDPACANAACVPPEDGATVCQDADGNPSSICEFVEGGKCSDWSVTRQAECQPPLRIWSPSTQGHCIANNTNSSCQISVPVEGFCVGGVEVCPDGYVKPLTDEEKQVNGTELLDFFTDRVVERAMSTRAIILYFPLLSRPMLKSTAQPAPPAQANFINAVIEVISQLEYMDSSTGEIDLVGKENIYVLSIRDDIDSSGYITPVTPFEPLKDEGIPHSFSCRWTDVYCEEYIPDEVVGPQPEPEPEPEPMYEPEPEEEEFEFDPGDPDMPRCIPCYIHWWNLYYAPVGYPNLLWDGTNNRRLLERGADFIYETLTGMSSDEESAASTDEQQQNTGSGRRRRAEEQQQPGADGQRRQMQDDFIAADCPPGYAGEACQWLFPCPEDFTGPLPDPPCYPRVRPDEYLQDTGLEVIITFNEYIDVGQMYHNMIVNNSDLENGLSARFAALEPPPGVGPMNTPYPMFATAADLGMQADVVREKFRDAFQDFGDTCFELCNPRNSCEDLCTDPRVVIDPEKSCSLMNTSYMLNDYLVTCDGMLNEANERRDENRSRIFYSYDHFEDIRGPLLLTTNGSIAYEDPSVEQVMEQARLIDQEYKLEKEIGMSTGGPGLTTPFTLLLQDVMAEAYKELTPFTTMQSNGTIQKKRTFTGLMLAGVEEAYWHTRTMTRYYVGPDVFEILGPQAFPPVRTRAVTFSFANNGQQYTSEGPRFFYYDPPAVHTMFPGLGPDYGDTFITMEGTNFIEGPGLRCLFDDWDPSRPDLKMASAFYWPWRLSCTSPPHVADPLDYVFVEQSNNDQQFTREGAIFDYYPAPNVTAVIPSTAPKRGNTLITVAGVKFLEKTLHYDTITLCRFGGPDWPVDEKTVAVIPRTNGVPSDNVMQCFTPETEAGTFDIDITLNGQQYTDGKVKFTFFGIDYIHPPLGPESGGTVVSVFGKGFTLTDGIRCRFGTMPVDGVYISFYEIQCTAPPYLVRDDIFRAVDFEITFYQAEWTDSGLNFTYQEDAFIFDVTPNIEGLGLGPDWGGTYLKVTGANFVNHWSRLNRCKFSRTAALGGGSYGSCGPTDPEVDADLCANVDVMLDDESIAQAACETAGDCTYIPAPDAEAAYPDYVVEAIYIDDKTMYCYAPRYYLTMCNAGLCEDEVVQVTVSYNNQQYTDVMSGLVREYMYYPQLKVESLLPDNGPYQLAKDANGRGGSLKFGQFIQPVGSGIGKPPRYVEGPEGHTVVTIYGQNFKPPPGLTEKTLCRWGNVTVMHTAIYSRTSMACETDDITPPGKYATEVTRNGQDWTENGPQFNFYSDRSVTQFVPRSGYIEGHTRVLMLGTGFVNSTQIRSWFGQHPPIEAEFRNFNKSESTWMATQYQDGEYFIRANPDLDPWKGYYIASTMIQSVAPEHGATGHLDVIVTSNEQEWTLADMTFYFSRTYAKASEAEMHLEPGTCGVDKKFLIIGRSKEGEIMSAGGDFFYVDLWGGDTRIRDFGKPFHFSNVIRDDRVGKEQVNLTDNANDPLDPLTDIAGTYWAHYYTTMSGVYYVEVMLSGDQIKDAPFHVAIHPNKTYPPNSFAFPGYSWNADGIVEMQAGLAALFHIQCRDSYGNNRTSSPSSEEISLKIRNVPSRAYIIRDMDDGTYDVWWVSIKLGFYQVNVSISDPFNDLIVQDDAAPRHEELCEDRHVCETGQTYPTMFIGYWWDYRKIDRTASLNGQLPSTSEMDWWDTYQLLEPSPWETECRPGEPSTFGCVASGNGLTFGRAGVANEILINAMDLYNNDILEGGGAFIWKLEGPTVRHYLEGGCAARGARKDCCEVMSMNCQSRVTDYEDGFYRFNYTANFASTPNMTERMLYALWIQLDGSWNQFRHIEGSPFFEIYMYPGDSYGPQSYAVGPGVETAITGVATTFKLFPVDRYGNHKQFGENESVVVTLTSDKGQVQYGLVQNCPKCIEGHTQWGQRPQGEYPFYHNVYYAPASSGFFFLKVEINGLEINYNADGPGQAKSFDPLHNPSFYITIPPPWPRILATSTDGRLQRRRRRAAEVLDTSMPSEVYAEDTEEFFPASSPLEGGAAIVLEVEYDSVEDYLRWLGVIKSVEHVPHTDHLTDHYVGPPECAPVNESVSLNSTCTNNTNVTYYEILFRFENLNDTGIDVEAAGYLDSSTRLIHVVAPPVRPDRSGGDFAWTVRLMARTPFQEFSHEWGVDFVYYDAERIAASGLTLSPALGPDYGHTLVSVSADGLFNSAQATCRFDGVVSPLRAIGVCSQSPLEAVTLEMCEALGECDHTKTVVDDGLSMQVPITSEAECAVAGSCFLEGEFVDSGTTEATCNAIEGAAWTAAIWTDAQAVWSIGGDPVLGCRSPSIVDVRNMSVPVHTVTVEISLNGQQYANTNATFMHYEPPQVHSVTPHTGPLRGATFSELVGTNFWETGEITCRHGRLGKSSPAMYNLTGSDAARMEVASMPIVDRWALYERTHADLFTPLYQSDHTSVIVCTSSRATEIYGPGEEVQVEVALNGQQYSSSVDLDNYFTFYKRPTLDAVDPVQGPVTGGTELILSASASDRFPNADTEETKCVFIQGDLVKMTDAVYDVLGSIVTCQTPDWPEAAHVKVEVAMNGQQPSISNVDFAFVPVVTGLSVHYGPFTGDTEILVEGIGFIDTSVSRRVGADVQVLDEGQGRCVFVDQMGWILETTVMATYVNESFVTCVSPSYAESLVKDADYDPMFLRDFFVRVTMDYCTDESCRFGNHTSELESDLDNGFAYYEPPELQLATNSESGVASAVVEGGILITLTAAYIHPLTDATLPVRCGFFGETGFFSSPAENVVQPAGMDGQITCRTPFVDAPQDTRVGLGLNGQQYSLEEIVFNFYDPTYPPEILSMNPASGEMQGNTIITLYGNNFANVPDLACRIDGPLAIQNDLTPTMDQGTVHPRNPTLTLDYETAFVSSHEIRCTTPPHYELRQGYPGWQNFDVEPDPTNLVPSVVEATNMPVGQSQYSTVTQEFTYVEVVRTDSVIYPPMDDIPEELTVDFDLPAPPVSNMPTDCSSGEACPSGFSCKYVRDAGASHCLLTVMAGVKTTFLIEARDEAGAVLPSGGEFFTVDLVQACTDTAELPEERCLPDGSGPVTEWYSAIDLDPTITLEMPDGFVSLPGYHLGVFELFTRGLYTLDVRTADRSITGPPVTLVVNYAEACPAACTVWGPGLLSNKVSGEDTTWLRLQSRDCFGNNRTESSDDPFQLGASLVRSPQNEQYNYPMAMLVDYFEGEVEYASGVDQTGGVYVINYRTTKAGEYEVRVTLNLEDGIVGEDVHGSPLTIFVDPGPTEPGAITAQGTDAFGYGRDRVTAGDNGLFLIVARDVFTNARLTGGELFNATFTADKTDPWYPDYVAGVPEVLEDLASLGVEVGPSYLAADIEDNGDSSYDATYVLTLAGDFRLDVFYVDPHDITNTIPVDGSPFLTTVDPADTHYPFCRMSGPGLDGSTAGEYTPLFVSAKDRFYNDRGPGSDNFTMVLTGSEPHNLEVQHGFAFTPFVHPLTGLGGISNTTYMMTVAGQYVLEIYDFRTRQHIANSPGSLTMHASETVAEKSMVIGLFGMIVRAGDMSTFIIQPRDRYGNNQTHSDDMAEGFRLIFSQLGQLPGFWFDSVNVPYTYELKPDGEGQVLAYIVLFPVIDYSISVMYLGVNIQGSPATVSVEPLDPPIMYKVKFYDELIRLRVVFDRKTNRANMAKDANCAEVFTDESASMLGDGSVCNWLNATELTIGLGYMPNITLGSIIHLRTDRRHNAGVLTEFSNSYAASGSAEVEISDTPPYVQAIIKGPALIGICEQVKIDASLSVGGGLSALDYKWMATDALDQLLFSKFPPMAFSTYVAIHARNERLPNEVTGELELSNGDKIVLGPVDVEPNQNYGVRVEVQNFLGYRDRAWWNFSKSCKPVPTIQIAGDSNLFKRSTEAVMLAGDAYLSEVGCACRGYDKDDCDANTYGGGDCLRCLWNEDEQICRVQPADQSDPGDEIPEAPLLYFQWEHVGTCLGWDMRPIPHVCVEWDSASVPSGLSVELNPVTQNTKNTMIQPGVLTPGETYTFMLTSGYVNRPTWNSTSLVVVTIDFGNLVASIKGGNRVVPTSRALVLDGSDSYDEDDTNEPMKYTWECTVSSGAACVNASHPALPEILPYPSTFDTPIFTVAPYSLCTSAQAEAKQCDVYTFILTVQKLFTPQGEENPRTASSTARITVVGGEPPGVAIDWSTNPLNKVLMKQNPGDPLRFVGSYTAPSTVDDSGIVSYNPVETKWFMTAGDLVEADGTLDDLRADGRLRTNRTDLNFVIAEHTLTPGGVYAFALRAVDLATEDTGFAEIEIKVNSPPAGGIFIVGPSEGVPMETQFLLNASMWNDEETDYPITFGFKYIKGGEEINIGEETDMNLKRNVLLPEGEVIVLNEETGYNITGLVVVCDIMDALLAATRRTRTVPLAAPSGRRALSEIDALDIVDSLVFDQSGMRQNFEDRGALDSVKDLLNIGAQVLNSAFGESAMGSEEAARRRRMGEDDIVFASNASDVGPQSDVVRKRAGLMNLLSMAVNRSEMTRSSIAQNGGVLAAITASSDQLDKSTLDQGMGTVEKSIAGASMTVSVGKAFGASLNNIYEGKQLVRPEFNEHLCPYTNGSEHFYACNKTDPHAGVTLRPCAEQSGPTQAELDAEALRIAMGEAPQLDDPSAGCCSTVLDEDEAEILCQMEAYRRAGSENDAIQAAAKNLISTMMTDKVKNEDGILLDTKELQLVGAVTDAANFGNLSLGAAFMPAYLREGVNKSSSTFELPTDILDSAIAASNTSLGKVDVQVINYAGNPKAWSLVDDTEVVGAVTSMTITAGGKEVPVRDRPSPIVIVIPIKRPVDPPNIAMNLSGLDYAAINSTSAPMETGWGSLFNETELWWTGDVVVTGWFGNDTYYWEGMEGAGPLEQEKCKFWDDDNLVWNEAGCVTVENTSEYVKCHCYHLTDFSVLIDEFKPELNLNVIDPFGDAALLANINPDNMFPLLLVCGLYCAYASLCFVAKRKDVADRRIALIKASEEDFDELPEEEEDEPDRTKCGKCCHTFSQALKTEHSLVSISSTAYDDEFSRCMRITVVFCLILGTYAVDAAFNAGDAGGDTIGAMVATSMAVTLCMYPSNVLFVYMFAKVGPTAKRMSDAKNQDKDGKRVAHMKNADKQKGKPAKSKKPKRRAGPGKPAASGMRKPPRRRPGMVGRRSKVGPAARYAVPASIEAAACTIQGVWRGYMVRKYLGQRVAGEGGAPTSDPPPPPVSEQGSARPRPSSKRPKIRGQSMGGGSGGFARQGAPEQLVPLPSDAPRRPRPRGRSQRGAGESSPSPSPGPPSRRSTTGGSSDMVPPPPPPSGRVRPSGNRMRKASRGSALGSAPLGVPPPPPPSGNARPRRSARGSSSRRMASTTAYSGSDSEGAPPPPPPLGAVARPRRRGGGRSSGASSASDSESGTARPMDGAPPAPGGVAMRPRRRGGGQRTAPNQPPPPAGSSGRPLNSGGPSVSFAARDEYSDGGASDAGSVGSFDSIQPRRRGDEVLGSRRPRRPPSVYAAPDPPPPPPPPAVQAAQVEVPDQVRRPRRRGAGQNQAGPPGSTQPPPPPPPSDGGGAGVPAAEDSRRPARRNNLPRRVQQQTPPPPPPPDSTGETMRPSYRGERQRLNITRSSVPPPPPAPADRGGFAPPSRRRRSQRGGSGGSSRHGSAPPRNPAAPGIPQMIWDAVIVIQCSFRGFRVRKDLSNFNAAAALRAGQGNNAPGSDGDATSFSQRPRRRMAPRSQPKKTVTGIPPPPPPSDDDSSDPRRRVGRRRTARAAVDPAQSALDPPPPPPPGGSGFGDINAAPDGSVAQYTPPRRRTVRAGPSASRRRTMQQATGVPDKINVAVTKLQAAFRGFHVRTTMQRGQELPPPPPAPDDDRVRPSRRKAGSVSVPPPPPGGTGRRPTRGRKKGGANKEMEIEALNRCASRVQAIYRGHLVRTGRVVKNGKVQPAKKSLRQKMMAGSTMGNAAFSKGRLGAESSGKQGKKRRRVKRPPRKQAPPLPYWFLHVTYALAWLWMLISGFFIVLYGLKFEVQVCSVAKFERNECEPGQEPIECDYPTKYGCMDVTYEWLYESSIAMGTTWFVVEPASLAVGMMRASLFGSMVGLLDYWEDIKDQIERFLPQ